MKIVEWLKKALQIHSPSQEMKKHEAEVAYYMGLYAYKWLEILGAIESTNMEEEDANDG